MKDKSIFDIEIESEHWQDLNLHFDEFFSKIFTLAQQELKEFGSFELCILLTSDKKMQEFNQEFRQKNTPTNVLSFESGLRDEKITPVYLGDLVFSYETIKAEATKDHKSFQDHFTHLAIHGILHLFGFDHEQSEAEAEKMEAFEIKILEKLGIENPYM